MVPNLGGPTGPHGRYQGTQFENHYHKISALERFSGKSLHYSSRSATLRLNELQVYWLKLLISARWSLVDRIGLPRGGQSLYQRWCSLRTLVVDERVMLGFRLWPLRHYPGSSFRSFSFWLLVVSTSTVQCSNHRAEECLICDISLHGKLALHVFVYLKHYLRVIDVRIMGVCHRVVEKIEESGFSHSFVGGRRFHHVVYHSCFGGPGTTQWGFSQDLYQNRICSS